MIRTYLSERTRGERDQSEVERVKDFKRNVLMSCIFSNIISLPGSSYLNLSL